jgi:hypothetical protein
MAMNINKPQKPKPAFKVTEAMKTPVKRTVLKPAIAERRASLLRWIEVNEKERAL